MPQLKIAYRLMVLKGHHRQPRNPDFELDLSMPSTLNISAGGQYSPACFPQLPYSLNGGSGLAQLSFWSVSDGTNGQALPPASFTQSIGSNALSITAWYYPVSGPALLSGAPAIVADAFSASHGKFIEDLFVDVTSNPSQTTDANTIGIVATAKALTLGARPNVPATNDVFSWWIRDNVFQPSGNAALSVAKGGTGIAIAIFGASSAGGGGSHVVIDPNRYAIWQWVDYGTMVDGGPHPWNPYVNELMTGVALAAAAQGVHASLRGELLKTAAKQIGLAAEAMRKSILSGGKE